MRKPLTGVERIYAELILSRLYDLGYRSIGERPKALRKINDWFNSPATIHNETLESVAHADDARIDKLAAQLGLKQ